MFRKKTIGRMSISFESNVRIRFTKGFSWGKFRLANCNLYCVWFYIGSYMLTIDFIGKCKDKACGMYEEETK